MPAASRSSPGLPFGDAARLALTQLGTHSVDLAGRWGRSDEDTLLEVAIRQLARQADAAALLGAAARRLVDGIALRPFLEPDGPFGPAWTAHPFVSPALKATYNLREPDLTRALAVLMKAPGGLGARRAVSFLRVLIEQAGAHAAGAALTNQSRVTVVPEHPVVSRRDGSALDGARRPAPTRIDLLLEWPVGTTGQRAVVVVEAKLGASVADGQLRSYREEARRRARGGPVALILLTATPDAVERRHRAWKSVRWLSLLRRWEGVLAAVNDHDPEFSRVRAHLWRHVLSLRALR